MWELIALRAIDTRASLLGTEDLLTGAALDKYTFIRSAYLQRRRNLVYDGKPPKDKDDDEISGARCHLAGSV
jgi:phospholipid-binding lipoprotein MlaA